MPSPSAWIKWAFLVLPVLGGCFYKQGEENLLAPQLKPTHELAGTRWVLTGWTSNPALPLYDDHGVVLGYYVDVFSNVDECSKTQHLYFVTGNPTAQPYSQSGTLVHTGGSLLCDDGPGQDTLRKGVWQWEAPDRILVPSAIAVNFFNQWYIKTLNYSTLRFEAANTLSGTNYTYTLTFTRE